MVELSGLNTDYASLAIELQTKMSQESDILAASFPAQTITLLANTLAGGLAMLNYSQLTHNLNNFIPFAFLKSAGYAIAATLGVAPRRKSGAQFNVTFIPDNGLTDFTQQIPGVVTIPQYTRFLMGGIVWHTRQSYIINPTDTQSQMILFEGDIYFEEFTSLGEAYMRWFIGNPYEVDNDTVRVLIDNVFWTEADEGSFVYYGPGDDVFLQQTSPDGKVLVFFGNGIYGSIPDLNSVIRIYYTVTLGSGGNDLGVGGSVTILDRVLIGTNQILSLNGASTTPSAGGMDEQDLDQIKYVIPRLYSAANRAVRRNDYIAHLLGPMCPLGFGDATTWGEYEEAQLEGINKLTMMNRAYWTGILTSVGEVEIDGIVITTTSGSVFSFILPDETVLPGSTEVDNNANTIAFKDTDGNGVLVSPDVSFISTVPTNPIISNGDFTGSLPANAIDGNFATYWQSNQIPTLNTPVRLAYDYGASTPQVVMSFRLRSSPDLSRDLRAFPNLVSIWVSNVAAPRMSIDDDWTVLRGAVSLNDPGPIAYSPWITIENNTAYRWVCIKIIGCWTNAQNYTKISEWEIQTAVSSSTINYDTLDVNMVYPAALPIATSINVTYFTPDLTDSQVTEVYNFLKLLNHYTTDINYVSPIMIRDDLEVEVYYLSGYDQNAIYSSVQNNLQSIFTVNMGILGRKIAHSDLMRAVITVTGVDYCIFLSPANGGDLLTQFGQFHHLSSLTIDMYVTDRTTAYNSYIANI